ncbi:NAD(P)-dependent oxidoreductase [Neoroseomonas soli]|uniref:Hydroxyacid dehydrogenase n=1 Tax=Neoroseomonas soli TaxID=1081025 RepID=A0A9X9X1Q7_9PROT|nr:NAD(P)-dependent oxidoreductase [Neoroseomonas soli]MBR0673336.1 hydroxyacid dehydrogenase [Neoroseomonas soli]
MTHSEAELPHSFQMAPLDALRDCADVVFNRSGRILVGRDLADAATGCQAIIAHRATPGTAETFAAAPDLIAFLRAAVDVSTIDLVAASAQGVLVTRVSPGFSDAVAELGLGMMVDLARGVSRAGAAYRSGRVPRPGSGFQLNGATLGIVGYGRIARRLAAIARGIGMTVLASDPHVEIGDPGVVAVSFGALLKGSDIVVCLAASTPETIGLFGQGAFGVMKRGAVFINLSRGELVDEGALEATLDRGHLRGAGLDVGSAEDQLPPPRLARRADVVATPHIGGVTREARAHQAMDIVRQVTALSEGRVPEGAINVDAAHRLMRLRPQTACAGGSEP